MTYFLVLILSFSFFITACSYLPFQGSRKPAATEEEKFNQFSELLLRALEFRAESLNFANRIQLNQISSPAMIRADVEHMKETGRKYIALRESLNKIAMSQYENFGFEHDIQLTPHRGTRVAKITNNNGSINSSNDQLIFSIDPNDIEGQKKIFDIQMALASALVLFDNYLIGIQPYNDNETLNYLLNYDSDEQMILQQIADRYANADIRLRVKKAIDFIDNVMKWRRENSVKTSDAESKIYEVIQTSAWYLKVREGSNFSNVFDFVSNLRNRINRTQVRSTRIVTFALSMGFGNFVGLVETRKGYLYKMSDWEKSQLMSELKPLDLVLEKTPFRLTDKMIPGHYGHVAIWIGTEQQLRELQIWDDIPEKHKKMIQSGHHMIEALRPGVQINTLDHFLNIDDLLVLRDKRDVSDGYRRKTILRALAQIGKEYDFNFDVDTHHRIVCSEIAYAVFADVQWPKDRLLGRNTISPDNVAKLAKGANAILEPVILYYNGVRFKKELKKSVELLLEANTQSYTQFELMHGIRHTPVSN